MEIEHGIKREVVYDKDWYHIRVIFHGTFKKIYVTFDRLASFGGFYQSDFDRAISVRTVTDENMEELVEKLFELHRQLIENGNKLIDKLDVIKLILK